MQTIYVKYLWWRVFFLTMFLCVNALETRSQSIVAIHQYDGTTCDETAIHPDEDITLFREIFGHEFLGGWERFTYSEIDSAAQFLDGTCLLYLDGFCDKEVFSDFYETYYDSIQQFVFDGGNLYINTQGEFYYGFDSVEGHLGAGSAADIIDTLSSIARGPFFVPLSSFKSVDYYTG